MITIDQNESIVDTRSYITDHEITTDNVAKIIECGRTRWKIENENNNILKTLNEYKPYIGNYFKARKNSGFVEGLNNKIKVLKRRCYGLVNTASLFQRLFLDLQGYECYA